MVRASVRARREVLLVRVCGLATQQYTLNSGMSRRELRALDAKITEKPVQYVAGFKVLKS